MPQETLTVIAAMLLFGVFHSLTAALVLKAGVAALVGERLYLGLYRLFYNLLSVITLLPVAWLLLRQPGELIWQISGLGAGLLLALRAIAALGVLVALLQIDLLRFAGLRQALAYVAGEPLPLPEEALSLRGLYGVVRHPLYFFSLLFLWATPSLSAAGLGFNLGATLYFLLGSLVEERKLLRQFGPAYRAYQQQVPWMIPFLPLHLPGPR